MKARLHRDSLDERIVPDGNPGSPPAGPPGQNPPQAQPPAPPKLTAAQAKELADRLPGMFQSARDLREMAKAKREEISANEAAITAALNNLNPLNPNLASYYAAMRVIGVLEQRRADLNSDINCLKATWTRLWDEIVGINKQLGDSGFPLVPIPQNLQGPLP